MVPIGIGVPSNLAFGDIIKMAKIAGKTQYRRLAAAAWGRAEKMRQVWPEAPVPVRGRAAVAVAYYRKLGERLQSRADLYGTTTPTLRQAKTLVRLLASAAIAL